MIPLAHWLRTDLRPLLDDLLSPEQVRARGLFRRTRWSALKAEHAERPRARTPTGCGR